MSIIIKGLNVPQDCTDCACTNYFGGCLLVAKLKPDVSIEEYDNEWQKAHAEHRRMKYCPIVDPTEYEQAMIEEILSEKDRPRIEIKEYSVDKNSLKKALITPSGAGIDFEKELNEAVKDFEDNYGSQQD